MRNKIISAILISISVCIISSCGSTDSSISGVSAEPIVQESSVDSNASESFSAAPQDDASSAYSSIPSGTFSDTGSGTIILRTSGGTSENGNVPVIYADSEALIMQIGLSSEGFDGSKLSFIYIDKKLVDKQQLGDRSDASLNLEGFMLEKGTHIVEVMQFDNDDTSTTPVTYKTVSYEIKSK